MRLGEKEEKEKKNEREGKQVMMRKKNEKKINGDNGQIGRGKESLGKR